MPRLLQRRAGDYIDLGIVGPFYLVARKHHQCQHTAEKENGIDEETDGSRATCRGCQNTKELIEDLVGFRVGAKEKH